MRAHLEAVRDVLAPLGYPVHLWYADGQAEVEGQRVPYVVLAGPSWSGPEDMPACGKSDVLDTDVRVTSVAANATGAAVVAGRVRELLSPRLSATRVPFSGRLVEVRYRPSSSGFVDVDREVTLPGSSSHPGYAVDVYRLHSVPL